MTAAGVVIGVAFGVVVAGLLAGRLTSTDVHRTPTKYPISTGDPV